MNDVELSIVAPVLNEETIVVELVQRCLDAATQVSERVEVLIVDDGSTDATATVLAALDEPRLRVLSLEHNRGQFGATQAGLAAARGGVVVVLDGDLQDPPETIPSLVQALRQAPEDVDAVFAVKVRRRDPIWFRAGRLGYHLLQRAFASTVMPSGAGSFTAMRAALARRIGRLPSQRSNLAAVIGALAPRTLTTPYEKAERYDGRSRVGVAGLAQEAFASLVLTGGLERLWLTAACALLVPGLLAPEVGGVYYMAGAALGFSEMVVVGRRRRAMLTDGGEAA